MTWSTSEIESLLHIHEKASGHGRMLTNIRDESMSRLQDIDLEAKKSQEERIAKAKAEADRKTKEVADKKRVEIIKQEPELVIESEEESGSIYPVDSGVVETPVIDRRV